MQLEKDWVNRPVVRLDMSLEELMSRLCVRISIWHFVITKRRGMWKRFRDILLQTDFIISLSVHIKTGEQVAILIDEYDSPLQHSWHTPDHEAYVPLFIAKCLQCLKPTTSMSVLSFLQA